MSVPGDVAVSAGTVSYLGPFTAEFRSRVTEGWKGKLKELRVPHTFGNTKKNTIFLLSKYLQVWWVGRGS